MYISFTFIVPYVIILNILLKCFTYNVKHFKNVKILQHKYNIMDVSNIKSLLELLGMRHYYMC